MRIGAKLTGQQLATMMAARQKNWRQSCWVFSLRPRMGIQRRWSLILIRESKAETTGIQTGHLRLVSATDGLHDGDITVDTSA